jgi:hypothetical protein
VVQQPSQFNMCQSVLIQPKIVTELSPKGEIEALNSSSAKTLMTSDDA